MSIPSHRRRPPDSLQPQSLRAPEDLGAAEICAAASGARIELAPELLSRVDAARARMVEALNAGEPIYGVTTGMGAASGVRLTEEQQRSHQARLMLARQVGTAPWMEASVVRAGIAARLRTFLNGDAGVSGGLCSALADLLNSGLVPAIPDGCHGAAGEIIPLSHLGGALTGTGQMLDAGGNLLDAGEALAAAGLAPYAFGPKEGIAMLQGTPLAMGAAFHHVRQARRYLSQHLSVLAAVARMTGSSRDPYELTLARGDGALRLILEQLGELLGEAESSTALQAPVSFRVTPAALAHAERSTQRLERSSLRALEGVSDSPAFLEGRFLGTAAFDGFALAADSDALRTALLHLGELSAARLHRLLDERINRRAPQLSAEPGAHAGLVAVHKGAVGTMHRLLGESAPSCLGLRETSFGQEDAQSFALEAAGALSRTLAGVRQVLAAELLALVQANRLAPFGTDHAELSSLLTSADAAVAPGVEDRAYGPDLTALSALLVETP